MSQQKRKPILLRESREDSFEDAISNLEEIAELKRIYSEFLKRKDEEILALKRENGILLRAALKKKMQR